VSAWLLTALVIAVLMGLRQTLQLRKAREQLLATERELQHVQQTCSLLAPPSVVQNLITAGTAPAPENKVATVLFADLVGFTALSERLAPELLGELLNGYFQRVDDAVTEHRGRISTFLGDGVLAYFGAFEPNPWQADDAVSAAVALSKSMTRWSHELSERGYPELRVGIGIHRGEGLAGLVGTQGRMEYAFVGRTVNIAARVQSLTRQNNCSILITEAVREKLNPGTPLRAVPPEPLKGIAEPVRTFEVVVGGAG
jgi:class 3 adenylate cyclase